MFSLIVGPQERQGRTLRGGATRLEGGATGPSSVFEGTCVNRRTPADGLHQYVKGSAGAAVPVRPLPPLFSRHLLAHKLLSRHEMSPLWNRARRNEGYKCFQHKEGHKGARWAGVVQAPGGTGDSHNAEGFRGATGAVAKAAPSRQKLTPATLWPSLSTRSTEARARPFSSCLPSAETA